jgi:hypothetical protein
MEMQEGRKGIPSLLSSQGSALHPTSHRWLYSLHAFIGIHESVVKSVIFFLLLMLAAFCFE